MATLAERFWAKVSKTDSCWLWTGSGYLNGYGSFGVKAGCIRPAHRIAYQLVVGPIPDGFEIDHLCRNRRCVNPNHLEVVTHRENMMRGDTVSARNSAKTHCLNGHAFAGANLMINVRGGRVCRICANARMQKVRDNDPDYRRKRYAREKAAHAKS